MYCPKCGIANLVDQKFCRGCGHGLAGHRIAFESNFEKALKNVKDGSWILGVGAACLTAISLLALVVWISQKDAAAFYILVPVLLFTIPATILGLVWLNRAYRALRPKEFAKVNSLIESKTTAIQLTEVASTDPLDQISPARASVTEHTTVNLESPTPNSTERPNRDTSQPRS